MGGGSQKQQNKRFGFVLADASSAGGNGSEERIPAAAPRQRDRPQQALLFALALETQSGGATRPQRRPNATESRSENTSASSVSASDLQPGGGEVSRLLRRSSGGSGGGVHPQRRSVLQVCARAPSKNPLREPRQPETHDVIPRASRLPALGEKVSTAQSQHRSISEVNCIYSHTAVED